MDSITTKVFSSLNFVEQYFASGGEPVGTHVPIMSVNDMPCLDKCIDMVNLLPICNWILTLYIFSDFTILWLLKFYLCLDVHSINLIAMVTLAFMLSLSLSHTHTHERTHARTHTHTRARAHTHTCVRAHAHGHHITCSFNISFLFCSCMLTYVCWSVACIQKWSTTVHIWGRSSLNGLMMIVTQARMIM